MQLVLAGHAGEIQAPGSRSQGLEVPASGSPGFILMSPPATGVQFTNRLAPSRYLTNQIHLNGSGVAAGDVDGDGWVDLYFAGLDSENALYLNRGEWKFHEVAAERGVACSEWDSTGVTLADADGDADLDLLINTIGQGTRLFTNDGRGYFRESTEAARLTSHKGGTSLALADVNGDGYLDLYVGNYRNTTLRDLPFTRFRIQYIEGRPVVVLVDGRPVTESDLIGRYTVNEQRRIIEHGQADDFYINNGNGSFTRVPFTGGYFLDDAGNRLPSIPYEWALSVRFHDINNDQLPDLYICNDFASVDRFWINTGRGFQLAPPLSLRKTSKNSMVVDFSDLDRDGWDDFFLTDMLSRDYQLRHTQVAEFEMAVNPPGVITNRPQYMRNMLFHNRGDLTFAEIGQFSGVAASEWTWNVAFIDVDLDGFEDVLVTNGHERDSLNMDVAREIEAERAKRRMNRREVLELRRRFPRLDTPNLAFRNQEDLTFKDVSDRWGFNLPAVSQGMALADLDGDGDLDVALNNLNSAASLYRNTTSAPRVAVRLRGIPPNTAGIGARIRVFGGTKTQSKEVTSGGRYLSSDDTQATFAASSEAPQRIEVWWRSGGVTVVTNVQSNFLYEVYESAKVSINSPPREPPTSLFEDASQSLEHHHHEVRFDDFDHDPLLPYKLSRSGPGVSARDFDGDGWDDLCITTGKGGSTAIFQNQGNLRFRRRSNLELQTTGNGDHTAVLSWTPPERSPAIVVGQSGFEATTPVPGSIQCRPLADGAPPPQSLALNGTDIGPIAIAPPTAGRGWILFAGGRMVPGHYGLPASSFFFAWTGEDWKPVSEWSQPLQRLGMVTAALFSDLDDDGRPDLVAATEWGPIRVFLNRESGFEEATSKMGLATHRGWWNGIAAADFDADGKMDLAATNWGRNTEHESYRRYSVRLYVGNAGGSYGHDIFECRYLPESKKWAPIRRLDFVTRAVPRIGLRFQSFHEYGGAGVHDLFDDASENLTQLEVNTVESGVFLNRGNQFEWHPFPREAQWAPAFGICPADFNGDGSLDLFLAQNFFATRPEVDRLDAGRGLLLAGDGSGGFRCLSGDSAGIRIYGEQRGAACGDFNRDGKTDLVVSQNGGPTRLFVNRTGRPGLRVRLVGSPENPDGFGTRVWWQTETDHGPLLEVQGSSGYWSQNSSTLIVTSPRPFPTLRLRWPDGKVHSVQVPPNAREISINHNGHVAKIR